MLKWETDNEVTPYATTRDWVLKIKKRPEPKLTSVAVIKSDDVYRLLVWQDGRKMFTSDQSFSTQQGAKEWVEAEEAISQQKQKGKYDKPLA